LASDLELAKGIQYTKSIETSYVLDPLPQIFLRFLLIRGIVSWVPPKYIRERSEEQHHKLREKYHILVDGEDIPPPIEHFTVSLSSLSVDCSIILTIGQDMKIPPTFLQFLREHKIVTPTPIQLQGIPAA
jgi:ATP-dependent RNA helicase DDX41